MTNDRPIRSPDSAPFLLCVFAPVREVVSLPFAICTRFALMSAMQQGGKEERRDRSELIRSKVYMLGSNQAGAWLYVILFVLLLARPAGAAEPNRLVIFDNDFYGPASTNLQAAALLLSDPEVRVLGLTVVTGDAWRDEEVAHTLRLLELIHRTDVPVVPGAVFPLVNTQAKTQAWQKAYGIIPWKGAWNDPREGLFPEYKPHEPFEVPPLPEGAPSIRASPQLAAEFLIEQVHKYPHQVTIVAAGPHTNLALACRLDPQFASLAKELIFMGGLINAGISKATGNPDFASDFNLLFDPEAAEIVLSANWPKITSVGDVTNETMFSDEVVQRIARMKTPLTQYIAKYAEKNVPLWDELTVGIFLDPSLIIRQTTVLMAVDVSHGPGYGSARIWSDEVAPHTGERKVTIVQEVDVNRFMETFVRAMQK
ncbi:MAG TPA: nucleoside hydrolase [Chthoniobacterales bacterium]|nr:nucleoside hydrolase [Chthoniobacterales bacterium]